MLCDAIHTRRNNTDGTHRRYRPNYVHALILYLVRFSLFVFGSLTLYTHLQSQNHLTILRLMCAYVLLMIREYAPVSWPSESYRQTVRHIPLIPLARG